MMTCMRGWNIPILRVLAILAAFIFLTACSSSDQRTFELSVTNRSDGPITVWLTKNGPPYEDNWLSPEDLVQNSPKMSDRIPGVQISPGRTAEAKVSGQFDPDTQAILRVYAATGLGSAPTG